MLNIERDAARAAREAKEGEPWGGYYFIRSAEIENLIHFLKLNNLGRVLELGCGNGFIACLLSPMSKNVTATDLFFKDSKTHTPGIENAKALIPKLGKRNISLLACSIESIPFKDDTFDTVFSSYTLQYLKDRRSAVDELKRVVRKNGVIILMLPGFVERFYAFIQFYLYFVIKFLKALNRKIFKSSNPSSEKGKRASFDLIGIKERYPYFPFPGPHGAYRNSAVEMMRHLPVNWNKEFVKRDLKIDRSFTTTFVPYPLLLTMSLEATSIISKIFMPLTRFFGNKPFIKYLGYNYCVVLKK